MVHDKKKFTLNPLLERSKIMFFLYISDLKLQVMKQRMNAINGPWHEKGKCFKYILPNSQDERIENSIWF